MKEVLARWYQRYLSEEEAVILLVMLTMAFAVMLFFGDILAPVLVAIVLAYLMQGVANVLRSSVTARLLGDSSAPKIRSRQIRLEKTRYNGVGRRWCINAL